MQGRPCTVLEAVKVPLLSDTELVLAAQPTTTQLTVAKRGAQKDNARGELIEEVDPVEYAGRRGDASADAGERRISSLGIAETVVVQLS